MHSRMIGLDADLDVIACHRRRIRFVPPKDGDLSTLHPSCLAILLEVNWPEGDEHPFAARGWRSRRAGRGISRDAHILILDWFGRDIAAEGCAPCVECLD